MAKKKKNVGLFLYRGISHLQNDEIRTETMGRETSDLLVEGTFDSPDALPFFQSIQNILENAPLGSGCGSSRKRIALDVYSSN